MNNTHRQGNNSFAADYVDVAQRIVMFRELYPQGSLRPYDPSEPIKIVTIGDKTYLQYVACAYRTPDDASPGIGVAWEPFPGRTPFTRDSEAMVAETSAWGRAIVAALAADTKKGVASADEVQAARARQSKPSNQPRSVDEAAPETPNVGTRATDKQVQRIAILRKSHPGLSEDEIYRSKLQAAYGVRSSKDLTEAQARDLITKLERNGANG